MATGTAATGAAAGISLAGNAAADHMRAAGDRSAEVLSRQMSSLEDRFDSLEKRHRNLVRAGAIAITVSTGIDVLTFL